MLLLDSFLKECCFNGCGMGLKVHINKKRLPGVLYTREGVAKFDPLKIQNCP